eukprot:GEMP01055803.1.p1 GENE.GEMP01055803.1~~GEMP01055803.1.p1  ORF type:complete len:311 (+),score=83.03 GEMP01055803.1:449-1381(+)
MGHVESHQEAARLWGLRPSTTRLPDDWDVVDSPDLWDNNITQVSLRHRNGSYEMYHGDVLLWRTVSAARIDLRYASSCLVYSVKKVPSFRAERTQRGKAIYTNGTLIVAAMEILWQFRPAQLPLDEHLGAAEPASPSSIYAAAYPCLLPSTSPEVKDPFFSKPCPCVTPRVCRKPDGACRKPLSTTRRCAPTMQVCDPLPPQDPTICEQHYVRRAAHSGDVDAMLQAGRSDEERYAWIMRAANSGSARARFERAYMVEWGLGTPQNATQAFALYRELLEDGEMKSVAMLRLARAYAMYAVGVLGESPWDE